jgi:hypothetical protein
MKRLLATLAMTVFTTGVLAQARPSTPALTCSQARQIVLGQGAVVLGTGGYTYDRYVRDWGFCQIDEYAEAAAVPTRDTPQCFVGYRCRSGPYWDWN